MPRSYPSVRERLDARAVRSPATGCLLWTGPPNDDMGYCRISIRGQMVYVHRAAWEDANVVVPDGMVLRHRCDVTNCIELDHLVVGTQAENVADMLRRRRHNRRGERNNQARLTWSEVREIRRLYGQGINRADIARRFGISHSQASNIVAGNHWKEAS